MRMPSNIFFDTYYEDLCNFVNTYLRDESLSEDIVQDIFVYLWEKKDSLPANCSIKSYLYTASKNKSLNYLRTDTSRKRIAGVLAPQFEPTVAEAGQYLEFKELTKIVQDAVEALPSQCKRIYRLSRDKALSNKEIALKLGISVKTVENQITIAIKKIKVYLQPHHDQIFIIFLLTIFS